MQGAHLLPEQVYRQLSRCDGMTGVEVIIDVQLCGAVHHEYRRNHVSQLVHLHAHELRQCTRTIAVRPYSEARATSTQAACRLAQCTEEVVQQDMRDTSIAL